MQPMPPTSPEEFRAAADLILADASADALPASVRAGLLAPNDPAIRAAVKALVEAGHFELLFRVLPLFWDRSDLGPWVRMTKATRLEATGEFAEAAALLRELFALFPKRAMAHWWTALARCQIGLGQFGEAEASLRECIARFPKSSRGFVDLADLLTRQDRLPEATAVWRAVIEDFRAEAKVRWFVAFANALRAIGKPDEADAVLDDLGRTLPDDPKTLPVLARAAADRQDWAQALDLWTQSGEKHAGASALEAANGRALALFRLWRIDEAMTIWRGLTAQNPDYAPALRQLANAAMELGDVELARSCLQSLIDRFTDETNAGSLGRLAKCLNELRRYAEAEAVLKRLEDMFPESPMAASERIRLLHDLERGQDDLAEHVEAALRRFPDNMEFQAAWVLILLGFGRIEEAEALVKALEEHEQGEYALISRLRWEADRGDAEHLERYVNPLAEGRDWTLTEATGVAEFLLWLKRVWSNDLASDILEGLAARYPHQLRLCVMRARVMIARREDEAALALIDALPPRFRRRDVLELKAWAAARRGDDECAKSLWRDNVDTQYFAAIRCPIDVLERLTPRDREPPRNGVTAYITFRNEAPQIPAFLAHHRKLGVRRFVFIDHESNDESRTLLLAEPDVVLYRSPDSYQFSSSGRRWVSELLEREGAGGWQLTVDPDEWFIYPGWETIPIDRFTAYLDSRGFEGVRGYMLDIFPRRLFNDAGEPTPREKYQYYDADYVWMGHDRPPYLSPSGGVRARLFGASEYLHKTPLWRSDRGRMINSHETTPLRFADVTGVLLHYKLMNIALRGRNVRVAQDGVGLVEADSSIEIMRRHSRYAARLDAIWRADLFKPGVSAALSDSLTLADRGIMETSPVYREWLRAER